MPVPILRIAYVPLKIIVACMENVGVVSISLCSKRADRALKQCGKRNTSYFNLNWQDTKQLSTLEKLVLFLLEAERTDKIILNEMEISLEITVSDRLSLEIRCDPHLSITVSMECISKMDQTPKYIRFNDACVPTVRTDNWRVNAFWNQKLKGFMAFLKYFNRNFKCTIDVDCRRPDKHFSRYFRKITRYLIQSQANVRNFSVISDIAIPDEDFKYVLENLKVTETFRSNLTVSDDFKFDGKIQASSLKVGGSWFTLRDLLRNEHEKVELLDTEFTEEQVNWMLKRIRLGKITKLRELNLRLNVDVNRMKFPKFTNYTLGWNMRNIETSLRRRTFVTNRWVTVQIRNRPWRWFCMKVFYGDPVDDDDDEDEDEEEDGEEEGEDEEESEMEVDSEEEEDGDEDEEDGEDAVEGEDQEDEEEESEDK